MHVRFVPLKTPLESLKYIEFNLQFLSYFINPEFNFLTGAAIDTITVLKHCGNLQLLYMLKIWPWF